MSSTPSAARSASTDPTGDPTRAATEAWFVGHGLPWFVPEERAAAREALRPRRLLPLLALTVVVAGAGGAALAWLVGQASAAPAVLLTAGLLAGAAYATTALRARPIVSWALTRTAASLRHAVRMASRALPLLLLFVTFLFVNAEAWELAGTMAPGVLWLVVVLLGSLAVLFLFVRLPEEVDRADDAVDDALLLRACRGTPLEETCRRLVDDPRADPAAYATVSGGARVNLILALVVIQAAQVLLLVLSVLVFFLVFGSLTMVDRIQLGWTGQTEGQLGNLPYLTNVSVELFQVSLFLAAFSGLYFTVSALTDDTYRSQFLSEVTRHLEQAVGTRAVYLAAYASPAPTPDEPAPPVGETPRAPGESPAP